MTKPWLQWGFNNIGESDDEVANEDDWDWLLHELEAWMKKVNPDGYWIASVENFGWSNRSGQALIDADTGAELLQKVLPKTENHFKIFKSGKTLRIQNYHHDSPVGNEWYSVRPATKKEREE